MSVQRKHRQRGFSLIGLIFFGGLLAMVGLVGAQVLPTALEFFNIQKAVQKASKEGTTPAEVRTVFEKSSAIDDFKSVTPKDLEITKEGDKIVVAFAYEREIHLVGPAFLTLKYEGRSK